MYYQIETLKQRLDTINQLRIGRALVSMKPTFQKVYSLLPTLLHYHHPLIPGYLEGDVPNGICFYTPNRIQRLYLKEFSLYCDIHFQKLPTPELPITGVYSMGSTSSVGQNFSSDLDIWIFHQSWLNTKERRLLQHKCNLIEFWASTLGVEVRFYLIDESLFRYNKNYYYFGKKEYGLRYGVLLLDEFYRTAVRLAGKRILWNMVPEDKEEYYDDYIMSLYRRGVVTSNEWLDLGGLTPLSFEEYFSTILRQIYKSINSPYKLALKMFLLEAYFWKYPSPQLLSKNIKQQLHNGKIISFGFDPYCMMLDYITKYLQAIDDTKRLDLARRCFYLKVCERLSKKQSYASWRRKVIKNLVREWGWSKAKLITLDNSTNWKINQLYEMHNELFNEIIQSFRKLTFFCKLKLFNISSISKEIETSICKFIALIKFF